MYLKTYLKVFVALALVEINALPQGVGNPKNPEGKYVKYCVVSPSSLFKNLTVENLRLSNNFSK